MKLNVHLQFEGEKVNNLKLADAIYDICGDMPELDAETVAHMILTQCVADKKEEDTNNGYPLR